MSLKHNNEQVLVSGTMATTGTIYSSISDVTFLDCCSYQLKIDSGNANGTFTIQASNDYDEAKSTGTFIDLAVTATVTSGQFSGSVTNAFLAISNWSLPYKYLRLKYVNTSGTGVCSAVFNAKGI